MATLDASCPDLVLRQAQDEVFGGGDAKVALMVRLPNHEGVALEIPHGNA